MVEMLSALLQRGSGQAAKLAQELGVELHIARNASRVADAGIATGHDNPLL